MKRKQLLLLLALLMTVATGAWAQDAKHRITATLNFSSQTKQQTLDVTLPYETTIGEVYTAVTGKAPASYLSLTAAEVKSGSNVSIGAFNEWNTPVTVSADGDATVEFTATLMGVNPTNGTITLSVAPIYAVKLADGTNDAENWTATVGQVADQELPVYTSKGNAVTLTYGGRLKVKNVTATTDAELVTLATPLTIEAITPGTIGVNINGTLDKGMKYSVNGGTKTDITSTTTIEGLKAGDKVRFYSNGTGNTAYTIPDPKVNISGGTAEVKVYGNIMSLLDEKGFATKTDLQNYAFFGLFLENTKLIDASELLLPAETLTPGCYQQMFQGCTALTKAPKLPATTLDQYCYSSMFQGCTSLTAAPELPATWLATGCYYAMFYGCESLTSAYVKAAYINVSDECASMFDGCTATGAVLHTTSGNKASWENTMGTGNWTVADDWQD